MRVTQTQPPTLQFHNSLLHLNLRTAPGRTRTCDFRIRNPVLYPTELPAHSAFSGSPGAIIAAPNPQYSIVCLQCVPLTCMGGSR